MAEVVNMGLFKKSKEKEVEARKIKTLIVDDEETSRLTLKTFLDDNFDCTMACNGKEAFDIICNGISQGDPFEFVCLDIMMPEMDGLETLQKIREKEQEHQIPKKEQCKVIMTTTASQVSKTMKAFHYGCGSYLVKPITKENLTREINKLPLRKGTNAQWRGR